MNETRYIASNALAGDLELLVPAGTDLGGIVHAVDCDTGERVTVKGWLFSWERI